MKATQLGSALSGLFSDLIGSAFLSAAAPEGGYYNKRPGPGQFNAHRRSMEKRATNEAAAKNHPERQPTRQQHRHADIRVAKANRSARKAKAMQSGVWGGMAATS